jgi:hypothetical protein
MTLVSLPSPILWPGLVGDVSTAPGLGNLTTLTSAGHYWSYILCAREAMTISHVAFRAGTVAGAPTLDVRIETVDPATGLPSGTLWGTNTNLSDGVAIVSNTNIIKALTASASIAAGQLFCVKIEFVTGTSFILQMMGSSATPYDSSLPYTVFTTGTPTKAALNHTGSIGLGSSATSFYQVPGLTPVSAVASNTFNNTNAAKRGLRFTPPMKCRVIGLRWFGANAVGDVNAAIYDDTTGTAVEVGSSSTAFDGDVNAASASPNRPFVVYFDNPVTCNAGTTYRAAIEPSSATNTNLYTFVLQSADYRGGSPAGTTAHYTTFVTGGWTDTATDTLPFMDILIDQVDDGTGSGASGGGQRVISG